MGRIPCFHAIVLPDLRHPSPVQVLDLDEFAWHGAETLEAEKHKRKAVPEDTSVPLPLQKFDGNSPICITKCHL